MRIDVVPLEREHWEAVRSIFREGIATSHRGKGVGSILLQTLIRESEAGGVWTLQAGIVPENAGSLALHRRAGFREVGRRERLGKLHGRWRDVVLLERRSRLVGLD